MIGDRDSLSAAYTIDDGNSLIPLADPLFGSYSMLRNQVASLQETHIFSPRMLNTFTAGFLARGFQSRFGVVDVVSPTCPSSPAADRAASSSAAAPPPRAAAAITSAGPNNAANVWNRRNLFTFADGVQITKGRHQISVGVWFQRVQDNEDTASRQLGQATFATLQTFLQGTVTTFPGGARRPTNWAGEVCSARGTSKTPSGCVPISRSRLGLRHEFTTGWNEVSGPRRQLHHRRAGRAADRAANFGNSVFTENNAKKLFGPRVGARVGRFRQRKDRGSRGLRHLLFADRRSQLPAELAAAVQWRGFVCGRACYRCSRSCRVCSRRHPAVPGVPTPCTTFAPAGRSSPTRRLRRCRNGTSRSSSS